MYSKDPSTASSTDEGTTSGDREELSSLDARVLRSILESGDLDLSTEKSMKKLLEDGTVKSTKAASNNDMGNTDTEFKSDFLQVRIFSFLPFNVIQLISFNERQQQILAEICQ